MHLKICITKHISIDSFVQFMRNHAKLGVSLRVLCYVVDTGYGLGRSLGHVYTRNSCPLLLLFPRKHGITTESFVELQVNKSKSLHNPAYSNSQLFLKGRGGADQ